MQKNIYSFLLILFVFFSSFCSSPAAESYEVILAPSIRKTARVLLINSYNKNLPWTGNITDAVENCLKNEKAFECILDIEYMDTKNIFSEEYLLKLRDLYLLKYKDSRIDAVISADDDAFNFCLKYQKELFKDAPLVFCGVNNFVDSVIQGRNISGVVEAFDIKSNLELIKKLHPRAKKIYVINDKTTTGAANKIIFRQHASLFEPAFSFEYLEDLTMEEVREKVSKLESTDVIFLMTFNRDKSGKVYSYDLSMRLIAEAAKVPIYGLWDFYLGGGVTGGMMISGRSQGETAAKTAAELIKTGKKASEMPVIKTSPNRYMFDYAMLEKHGIDQSLLPEGSFILNQPFSFYSVDKNIFWFIIFLIIILVMLSVFLIVNILERRSAEKELLLANRKLENMINELESIVEKRTRELLETNKNLHQQIAEREKVQKDLLESETKYRTLAENALDAISETAADGSILYISPNFKEILGCGASGENGGSFVNFVYGPDRGIVKAMFDTIEKQGFANEIIFRNSGFDSNPIWLESSGKTFTSADGKPHVVIVTRNVSERKKIEEEMVKNAKLESLGLLAGGIAHDFNNVLMGIIGNVTLAKRRCQDGNIYELLTRAERVSYKAKSLTEQLITFSKGGQPIKKLANINDLLYEAVQFSLSGSSMRSEFELHPGLWHAEVDEGQLIQVITNIAINARQASGLNGLITVKTENISVEKPNERFVKAGNYVKITMRDNGGGIPAQNLKKIFDPYFTTKSDGRGIGLAAAHSIIKNHQGLIDVESKDGEGTAFFIYLPAGVSQADPQA